MKTATIKTTDLKLARVKYFDMAHNGAELSCPEAYAFLRRVGDQYINVFDELEQLPVLDRAPYAMVTPDGESYGNRLFHICGELTDGPCYVIEPFPVSEIFQQDVISTNTLKEYMYVSSKFYVDRMHLIEEEGNKASRRISLLRKYLSDSKKMREFKKYIASHEHAKEYVK